MQHGAAFLVNVHRVERQMSPREIFVPASRDQRNASLQMCCQRRGNGESRPTIWNFLIAFGERRKLG